MMKDLGLFRSMYRSFSREALALLPLIAACGLIGCRTGDSDGPPGNAAAGDENANGDDSTGIGGLHDPLSMPASPTLSVENFRSASECASCHPNHYEQWQTSMHAYATMDPVWRTLVAVRQADFDGQRDQFCTQCHSAIATRGSEVHPNFSFDDFSPISLEGVTCEACHKVVSIERVYNSGHVLDETGPLRGPIEDPIPNSFHQSEYSALYDTSEFCGACHDIIEQHGLMLERPYQEWAASPAAAEGRNCQSCHMATYRGKAADLPGVPERDDIHEHYFIGVDMPMTDDFIPDEEVREDRRARVEALLKTAGSIKIEAAESVNAGQQLDLYVTIQNLNDAHDLPTGSTFNRQLWIAVTATDAEGNILYQTGHLDDNGDLRNYWSGLDKYGDADLMSFSSGFLDERGNPTVFPWFAAEHISNTLSPLYVRTFTLFVPTETDTVGPITIEAQFRFRSLPPFLLRALGAGALVEKLRIYDIDDDAITVEVVKE